MHLTKDGGQLHALVNTAMNLIGRGIYLLTARLSASQERFCSTEVLRLFWQNVSCFAEKLQGTSSVYKRPVQTLTFQ
jgi:hypothetical protein